MSMILVTGWFIRKRPIAAPDLMGLWEIWVIMGDDSVIEAAEDDALEGYDLGASRGGGGGAFAGAHDEKEADDGDLTDDGEV